MPAGIADENGQGGYRGLGGLPPRRSPRLYQLGEVHGPTRGDWQITSVAMSQDTLAYRARGQPCYKELRSAAVVDGA